MATKTGTFKFILEQVHTLKLWTLTSLFISDDVVVQFLLEFHKYPLLKWIFMILIFVSS